MDDLAVEVTQISKSFKLPHERYSGLKQTILNFGFGKKFEQQHVLKDISFNIKKGEFFGIVGQNGSGKSTLLKILAQIYIPDRGNIHVNGSLTPFIELGVGFNPELTGRENVYLNGALLGFDRQQVADMYDEIVEFAELSEFMDQKLKNYSSGMQVRLAFSIAVRAKSDILLIDEVLAVGDEAFQRKCLDVFEKYKAEKQTIILVTHDMEMVRKFCNRAMLINRGEIVEIGNPRAVASKYSEMNQSTTDAWAARETVKGSKYIKAKVLSAVGRPKQSFMIGEKAIFDISWDGLDPDLIESIGVNIFKQSGEHITGINTRFAKHPAGWKSRGQIAIEFEINITPGKYFLLVEAFRNEGVVEDALLEGPQFTVKPEPIDWSGLVELPHKWLDK